MRISKDATETKNINLTSIASIEHKIAKLKKKKLYYFALDVIDFGMDIDEAMSAPRFSTGHFIGSFGQDPPKLGGLRLHESIDRKVQKQLAKRGHKVREIPYNIGGIAMLYIDPETGMVYGAGAAASGIE